MHAIRRSEFDTHFEHFPRGRTMATDDKHAGLAPQSSDCFALENQDRRGFMKHSVLLGAAAAVGPMLGAGAHAQGKKDILCTQGTMMKQRTLGTMKVSEIGLGCMTFAGNYNAPVS